MARALRRSGARELFVDWPVGCGHHDAKLTSGDLWPVDAI
jgi:hypothetical protein